MITKYYTVSVSSEKDNAFHEFINDSKAVILEAVEGKPMCFCYYLEQDEITPWHRVYTSEVKEITKENTVICTYPAINCEKIKVVTENSTYTFTYEERQAEVSDKISITPF